MIMVQICFLKRLDSSQVYLPWQQGSQNVKLNLGEIFTEGFPYYGETVLNQTFVSVWINSYYLDKLSFAISHQKCFQSVSKSVLLLR